MTFSKDRKKKRIRSLSSRGRGSYSTVWACCCIAFTASSSCIGLAQGFSLPINTLVSSPISRHLLARSAHSTSTGPLPIVTPAEPSSNPTVPPTNFVSSLSSDQNPDIRNIYVQVSSSSSIEYDSTVTQTIGGESSTSTRSTTAGPFLASSTSTVVPASYDIPQPFDSSLSNGFVSTSCPSFIQTFLANPTFISCAPFSLLLTTSSAFFAAERSPYSLLPHVLASSCSAPDATCSTLMSGLATAIKSKGNCQQDLAAGNALAQQALVGFQNYEMMRRTGCQINNSTGKYCFVEASAAANSSQLYFYYLPTGTSLPAGTNPTCDSCTKGVLDIYSEYATDPTLPISRTYASGRSAAALSCGPNFAPLISLKNSTPGSQYSLIPGRDLLTGGVGMISILAALVLIMGVA